MLHGGEKAAFGLWFSFAKKTFDSFVTKTNVSNACMSELPDTKTRILDVAEELFSDQGFDRVSIRDITEVAKVNLAAVNYHFGGKDEMIAAVFERRMAPLNEARLAALTEVERKAGDKPPRVEDILEALIRPALTCCAASSNGSAFSKLLGRCLSETRPELEALLKKQFEPLLERLDAAFMRALPGLSRPDIFWRIKFTFGALHHWLMTRDRFIPSWAEGVDTEEQILKLIAYTAAGFRSH